MKVVIFDIDGLLGGLHQAVSQGDPRLRSG